MKKIANILLIVFILLLFYITKDIDILPLAISFSMYILFNSIFSTTSIKEVIGYYQNKKYYYSSDKIFIYTIMFIILIGGVLTIISYLVGDFLNIDKMSIINIVMSFSVVSNIILKIICEYLDIIGYKKISTNLINLYEIIVVIINTILSILLFKIFKLNTNINIIILYLVSIVIFIITLIILNLLIFCKKKKNSKKKEENEISYVDEIKKIILGNQIEIISNITSSTYIYISIIILYYTLTNKYNYDNIEVSKIITSTYLYGLIIIFFIYKIIKKYLNINYNNIKETFNNNINKIIKTSLYVCILLITISIPISNLFKSDYNIISNLIPVLFLYILYSYVTNINIKYNKDKTNLIILIIGLIIKIIFELPFINAVYRMGYSLTLGSSLSTALGLITSIILGIIFIKNKFKLNLLTNFNNILNIIYESIIYSLILILFTFVVKIDTIGTLSNIFVIIFYIFVTILFHIIKRIIKNK